MTKFGEVDTTVGVVDGRVAMSADGEAMLYIDSRDHTPLRLAETHATLRVEGDDFRAEFDLDGRDLDAFIDALNHVREEYADAE